MGTAARIIKAPAPAMKRKNMNSPTLTLPPRKAPETMIKIAETAMAHLRPNLSATMGRHKVPRNPPVWNRPFIVEMRSVPLLLVPRLKYKINDGWPSLWC
jgi:hypothetical protein